MSNVSEKLKAIQELAGNVQMVSEQTHDVNAFVIGRNRTASGAANFAAANPFINGETVSEQDFDEYLSAIQVNDSSGNWTQLRNYLEANVSSPTVFVVGTIQQKIYAVGLLDGCFVGISTFGVQT